MKTLDWNNLGLTTESLIERLGRLKSASRFDSLDLRGNKIESLDGVDLPDNLEWIDLEGNNIESLDGVEFPDSLKWIDLRDNNTPQEEVDNIPGNIEVFAWPAE